MPGHSSADNKSVIDEFHQVVNMTPKELESWLDTDESKAVGQKDGDDESIGETGAYGVVPAVRFCVRPEGSQVRAAHYRAVTEEKG